MSSTKNSQKKRNSNNEDENERKRMKTQNGQSLSFGSSSDLRNWRIFNFLNKEFASKIHIIMAFGDDAALIVTKDKMVYGLGNNCNNRLGIGNIVNTLQPKKVEVLCGKNIKTFCCNNSMACIYALTQEGEVYSWGFICYGLGQEMQNERVVRTPIKLASLREKCIVDIACSNDHTLALTKDGEMYTWGNEKYLEISNGVADNLPWLIQCKEKIICIACGLFFNVAITESGKVCSWGLNNYGQLGTEKIVKEINPCVIAVLKDVIISKVVCGSAHILALAANGMIYSWGRNNVGQLGLGKKSDKEVMPTMLYIPEVGRVGGVIDIAARHNGSLALGSDGRVYIWGQCFNEEITIPTVTAFSNMYDVLAYNVPYIIRHVPQILNCEEKVNILECLGKMFDDRSTSDFTIQVQQRPIYVHKVILSARCRHFRNMFHYNWLVNGQRISSSAILVHDRFSFPVYKAFLKYLYTGIIDLPVGETLELVKLADEFDEKNLKRDCIQKIKGKITTSNVISFYYKAIEYNEKELKEFCYHFAQDNRMKEIENFSRTEENQDKNAECEIKVEIVESPESPDQPEQILQSGHGAHARLSNSNATRRTLLSSRTPRCVSLSVARKLSQGKVVRSSPNQKTREKIERK